MTKEQLIELVKIELGNTGRFGDRTIALKIELAFNDVLREIFKRNPDYFSFYRKYFPNQTIKTAYGIKYVDSPKGMIQVEGSDNAVMITTNNSKYKAIQFTPMNDAQARSVNHLEVGQVDDSIGYVVYRDKIEFDDKLPDDIEQVSVAAPVGLSQYADDDEVPLPGGVSERIVTMIVDIFEKRNPYKTVNDANPNVRA